MSARRLTRTVLVVAFAVVAFVVYWHGYWSHPVLPGTSTQYPLGWWGWWDQGQYFKSAQALHAHDFAPASHHYPIGYAFLGMLFAGWLPNHIFLIPDLFFYAVICGAFVLIARRFLPLPEALLIGLAGIAGQSLVMENLIIPWTSIPRFAVLYALTALAIWRPADRRYPLWVGLGLGMIYTIRPGDVFFAAPLAMVGFATALRERRWISFTARLAAGLLPFAALFHGFNFYVFGQAMPKAYAVAVGLIGFNLRFLPLKTFSMFLDPRLLFAEPDSLFSTFPYLMLALPGAVAFAKRLRGTGIAIAATQVLCWGYYLAFSDFTPQNVFQFHVVHYVTWLLPFGALYAYLSFRLAWRELGVLWTAGLFALSAILILTPGVTVQAVSGRSENVGRAACPPAAATLCTLSFACPRETFDVAFFQDLTLAGHTIVTVQLDDRTLLHLRDYRVVNSPDGAGVSLLFYGGQRAGRLTLGVQGGPPATIGTTGAWFSRTAWRPTWRAVPWLTPTPGAGLHYAENMPRENPTAIDVVARSTDDPQLRQAFRMKVPGDFSLEAVVWPEAVQPASATIVSNHPGLGGHEGFSLEQAGNKPTRFALVFGDGKRWMRSAEIDLEAGRRHHLAASKTGRTLRVWRDGKVIAQAELEGEMAPSSFPIRIGDWLYGGRAFAGRIEKIRIVPGTFTDVEVAAYAAR